METDQVFQIQCEFEMTCYPAKWNNNTTTP